MLRGESWLLLLAGGELLAVAGLEARALHVAADSALALAALLGRLRGGSLTDGAFTAFGERRTLGLRLLRGVVLRVLRIADSYKLIEVLLRR